MTNPRPIQVNILNSELWSLVKISDIINDNTLREIVYMGKLYVLKINFGISSKKLLV